MKKVLLYRKKTVILAVFFLFFLILTAILMRPKPLPFGGNDKSRREYLSAYGLETGEYTEKTVAVPAFSAEYLSF